MSTYDLEEQEQLAALKAWWKDHGSAIVLGAALVLVVIGAWNGWRWYQRSEAAQAALLYESLQNAARAGDLKTTGEIAGNILEKYPRTAYAPLAALISAKAQFLSGDRKTARAQLEWVVDHAQDDGIRAIARLRLSSVLLDEKEYDASLKVLDAKPATGFEALYASLRGDIFLAQKKLPEARSAYKEALEKVQAGEGALRGALRLKLDALGDG